MSELRQRTEDSKLLETRGDALLVVDVQRDFLPGGALAVPHGDAVIPALNRWLARAQRAGAPVFASRDWHPADHCSFTARGGPWPPHCIAGSAGAQLASRDLQNPLGGRVPGLDDAVLILHHDAVGDGVDDEPVDRRVDVGGIDGGAERAGGECEGEERTGQSEGASSGSGVAVVRRGGLRVTVKHISIARSG